MSNEDIVERLRKAHEMQEGRDSGLLCEAANEIAGLREALDEMRQLAGMPSVNEIGAGLIQSFRLERD